MFTSCTASSPCKSEVAPNGSHLRRLSNAQSISNLDPYPLIRRNAHHEGDSSGPITSRLRDHYTTTSKPRQSRRTAGKIRRKFSTGIWPASNRSYIIPHGGVGRWPLMKVVGGLFDIPAYPAVVIARRLHVAPLTVG